MCWSYISGENFCQSTVFYGFPAGNLMKSHPDHRTMIREIKLSSTGSKQEKVKWMLTAHLACLYYSTFQKHVKYIEQ